MTPVDIRPLAPSELPYAVTVTSRAFWPDPLFGFFARSALHEHKLMPVFIGATMRDCVRFGEVDVAVRPEAITVEAAPGLAGSLPGRIAKASYLGTHMEYSVDTAAGRLFATCPRVDRPLAAGDAVGLVLRIIRQHITNYDAVLSLFENLKLDELATMGRNEFCFILLATKLKGATGCPVRPVALF